MKTILLFTTLLLSGCSQRLEYLKYKKEIKSGFIWEVEILNEHKISIKKLRDSCEYNFTLLPFPEWKKRISYYSEK